MSLMKKTMLAFGSILLVFLIAFGSIFYGLKDIQSNKAVLNDQIRLKDLVFELKTDTQKYLLHESKASEQRVHRDIKKIDTHIQNTSGTLEEDIKMPQNLKRFQEAFARYMQLVQRSKALIEQNRQNINKARRASEKLRDDALKDLNKHLNIASLRVLKDQIELLDYVTRIKIKEKNYLLYRKEKDYHAILSLLHKLQIHIDNTPGTLEEDAGIPDYLKRYEKGLTALHAVFNQEAAIQKSLNKESQALITKADTLLTNANQEMDHAVSMMQMTMVIILIISLIIMALIMLLAKKHLIAVVDDLNRKIDELSSREGDLSRKIEVQSNDEIGQIAHGINRFMEKLKKMILNLQDSARIAKNATQSL